MPNPFHSTWLPDPKNSHFGHAEVPPTGSFFTPSVSSSPWQHHFLWCPFRVGEIIRWPCRPSQSHHQNAWFHAMTICIGFLGLKHQVSTRDDTRFRRKTFFSVWDCCFRRISKKWDAIIYQIIYISQVEKNGGKNSERIWYGCSTKQHKGGHATGVEGWHPHAVTYIPNRDTHQIICMIWTTSLKKRHYTTITPQIESLSKLDVFQRYSQYLEDPSYWPTLFSKADLSQARWAPELFEKPQLRVHEAALSTFFCFQFRDSKMWCSCESKYDNHKTSHAAAEEVRCTESTNLSWLHNLWNEIITSLKSRSILQVQHSFFLARYASSWWITLHLSPLSSGCNIEQKVWLPRRFTTLVSRKSVWR